LSLYEFIESIGTEVKAAEEQEIIAEIQDEEERDVRLAVHRSLMEDVC
jgi:hypothetical protein